MKQKILGKNLLGLLKLLDLKRDVIACTDLLADVKSEPPMSPTEYSSAKSWAINSKITGIQGKYDVTAFEDHLAFKIEITRVTSTNDGRKDQSKSWETAGKLMFSK